MKDSFEKKTPNQSTKETLKSIFEYSDYRAYLRDYYQHSKVAKRSFSFRLFSRLCGFKSSNFLMLVMNGKSRLTSVSVEKVIQGVRFNKEEAEFFRNLVGFNEAKTPSQKAQYAQEMIRSRSYKRVFYLSEAQYRYLGTWYLPVIRSVIGIQGIPQDLKWIAEHIHPKLTEEQVKGAIEDLLTLGLLSKDDHGRLFQNNAMTATQSEIVSVFAAQYHKQMLQLASESIDRFARERRHLVGVTVALDSDAIQRVKEMAEKFRNEIMALALRSPSADAVYQVNLQTFPLFLDSSSKTEKK